METVTQELINDSIKEKVQLILSARFVDIKIRKDGKEYEFEGDFIKSIIYKSDYYNQTFNHESTI